MNPLTPSGITEAEAASLTDLLQTHLSNSDEFEVMERSEVDKVLKEQGFQQAGLCSETSCAMQMGQLLGVRYIVIGNVGLVGRTYTVNARLTDVATGRIVRNVTELHKGSIDGLVTDVMPVVARKLAGKKVEKKKGGIRPAAIIAGAAGVAAIPAVVFFMRSRDSEKEQNSSSEVTIQWGE
ncbi:MAG: CsgG/HfaB family protein [Fibrobacterota bacterium]